MGIVRMTLSQGNKSVLVQADCTVLVTVAALIVIPMHETQLKTLFFRTSWYPFANSTFCLGVHCTSMALHWLFSLYKCLTLPAKFALRRAANFCLNMALTW